MASLLKGRDTYGLEEIQGSFSGPSLLNVLEVQGGATGDNGEHKELLREKGLEYSLEIMSETWGSTARQYSLTFLVHPGRERQWGLGQQPQGSVDFEGRQRESSSLSSCVPLGKSLNHNKPQSSHL